MDCSHARLLLFFSGRGPSELAAEDAETLRIHLEQCPPCRTEAHREQRADAAIGPVLRHVPAPADLQGRILQRLQRERRPKPWSWVAGAAALLIAVGIGLAFFYHSTATAFDHEIFNEWRTTSREKVESWFRKQAVAMTMPSDSIFRLEDLDSWEVVAMQRQRIAKLLYVKTNDAGQVIAVAHVYVLPKNAFRFDEDFAHRARGKSGNIILEEEGEYYFLLVFMRGSHSAFGRAA